MHVCIVLQANTFYRELKKLYDDTEVVFSLQALYRLRVTRFRLRALKSCLRAPKSRLRASKSLLRGQPRLRTPKSRLSLSNP